MSVNPNTYGYIQGIATRFDRLKFLETETPSLILDRAKDGIKWETKEGTAFFACRAMRRDIANTFPREVAGLIASQAKTFSQWVVMLGLTDPQIHMKQFALDQSAAALLHRMHIARNENPQRISCSRLFLKRHLPIRQMHKKSN